MTTAESNNHPVAKPVLYLDLDGTVRHGPNGGFVNSPEDVNIYPEALRNMREYARRGWRIIGVTNQGGVAMGYLTLGEMQRALHRTNELCEHLFDRITACVHHPEAKDPEYAVCWCRKPRIGGLVLAATGLADQHNEYYPPHMALFVGDRPEDEQCAANAGIAFMSAETWRSQVWEES